MKTEFEIEFAGDERGRYTGSIKIIGSKPNNAPYIAIQLNEPKHVIGFVQDKDAERFAVNILKALKSKKLKPHT